MSHPRDSMEQIAADSIEHSTIRAIADHVQRCSLITTDLRAVGILIEASAQLQQRATEILREQAIRLANQSRQS